MSTITDGEFGKINIRKSKLARNISVRLGPDGQLKATLPYYAPIFLAKRMIETSRQKLRQLISSQSTDDQYLNNAVIGKSHKLVFIKSTDDQFRVSRQGLKIIVSIPAGKSLDNIMVAQIRAETIKAIRKEAKSYLPIRARHLANKYDLSFGQLRFSHASSRWGSCNNKKTISLNIALMKLPFELIDYIIIHELAHTVYLNHSQQFWNLVSSIDKDYRKHRSAVKSYQPHI